MDASTSNSLNKALSNIQSWIYVPGPGSCNVPNMTNEGTKKLVPTETFKENLISNFNASGFTTECATVNRDDNSGIMNKAKYLSFNLYASAMEVTRGNANVIYAWYGGTKEELKTIVSKCFIYPPNMDDITFGAYLSPCNRTPINIQLADEDGFMHMLLCRVILGNTEVVVPGSVQYKPSSEEFDTGVDSFESPNNYVIWNVNVNTHILPKFMISFRERSSNKGLFKTSKSGRNHINNIMKELTKLLPADAVESISKHHSEYNKRTITSIKLVRRLREIAGSELLRRAVIVCLEKRGHKALRDQRDSEFVSELISQFSSQLKIKSKDKR